MTKKRKKKLPWSKLQTIDKRFLDLRFSGIEDAIQMMGGKDKKQTVYGGTGFYVRKNKKPDLRQSNEEFQDSYNNYEEDAEYTGKAYLKMSRKYRGKEYYYAVTIEDISKEEADL